MKYLSGLIVLVCALSLTHGQLRAQSNIPAYHNAPPAKGEKLPAVLTQQQLQESGMTEPAQREAYKAAAKIPNVLYQLPCFCYCDRHAGHKSLHSCFEGTHGANCGTCMAEALYAYQMKNKGWTVSQIRDGIMRHDYQQIDLQNPAPVL